MQYNILVPEDLEDSRFYLKTLLETKGHKVTEAVNGKEALQLFQQTSFDLVITDIGMPEMDGLTLLRRIKIARPETPVIVISAHHELESVVEALRSGACDYITKPYEEQDVYDSIDRVTRLRTSEITDTICASYLIHESRHFEFENNPDQINAMAGFLAHSAAGLIVNGETQSIQISLIEALSNAVFHGNLEISSDIKNSQDLKSLENFDRLVNDKLKTAPYNSRKVTIDYSLDEHKICYVISDEGPGFDYHHLPDPLAPESFEKPSGRGLLMMRTFCDEVSWNKTGNEITLIKYRVDVKGLQPP